MRGEGTRTFNQNPEKNLASKKRRRCSLVDLKEETANVLHREEKLKRSGRQGRGKGDWGPNPKNQKKWGSCEDSAGKRRENPS